MFEGRERRQLDEAFPGKNPLSLQTDQFAERRARALDAYLQILVHLARTKPQVSRIIRRDLLNVPESEEKITVNVKREISPAVRTPNGLNSEIDRLRHCKLEDLRESDFEALQVHIRQLAEKRNPSGEELGCVEKFYALRREWEVERIKKGRFDCGTFSLGAKSGKPEPEGTMGAETVRTKGSETKETSAILPSTAATTVPSTISTTISNTTASSAIAGLNHYKRDQEAILNELAATVHEQRKLSQEIYAEVAQHQKLIDSVSRKQEGTIEGFKESSVRVKKLQ